MKKASLHGAKQNGNREVAQLNERLERNLLAYAAAAGAAGVSLLALSSSAQAKVIYTKAHQVISPNTSFNLDLNHDGTTDFVIANKSYTTNYGSLDRVYLNPPLANSFIGASVGASALPEGSRVGSGAPFYSGQSGGRSATMVVAGYRLENGSHKRGPWFKAKNRYLGFRFTIDGTAHYGWARLSITEGRASQHATFTAHLTGYAYETIPNKAIITGQTKGPDVITVEPATLGHLAGGSSAMRNWRPRQVTAWTP
jgi:hypothetical protein